MTRPEWLLLGVCNISAGHLLRTPQDSHGWKLGNKINELVSYPRCLQQVHLVLLMGVHTTTSILLTHMCQLDFSLKT